MSDFGGRHSLTEELSALERRRNTLEQLIAVTRHLHNLDQLLRKILLLSDPTGKMPPRAVVFFERLSLQTRELPTEDVQGRVRALEARLKRYTRALRVELEGEDDHPLSGPEFERVSEQIASLRRYGQTAVGLRVMLQKRGCPSKPLVIDVPRMALETRITQLKQKETHYRQKVVDEMRGILGDLEAILSAEGVSDTLRESLTVVEAELQSDLEHVLAGGNIEDLPNRYESIELAAEYRPPKPKAKSAPSQPNEHGSDQSIPGFTGRSDSAREVGRLRVFWRWIRTPWKVTWREAEKIEQWFQQQKKTGSD
jgi:hypothetical protein